MTTSLASNPAPGTGGAPGSAPGSAPSPRRGRRGTLVLVVLAAVAVIVLGVAVGWRVAGSSSRGREVVVLGDSITDQAADPLHQRFDGSYAITVSGVNGARADERVADAAAYASTTPGQVIINLGTNDVLQSTPTDESAASLTHIAEAFSDTRCLHLVTVNESMVDLARPQLHEQAVALNDRIRAIAAQHGWDVIDWAGIVAASDKAGNPQGPLTVDTVHPSPAGQQRLLDAYAEALGRC